MKTFSDLKTAVQKANSPEQAAGTFIDSTVSIVKSNRNDPALLDNFINELSSNRQNLVHSITTGKSGSVS